MPNPFSNKRIPISKQTSVQITPEILRVSVKVALERRFSRLGNRFRKPSAKLWFRHLKSQFLLAAVTTVHTKLYIAVSTLDPEVLSSVDDIVLEPPKTMNTGIKYRLDYLFMDSEQGQIKKITIRVRRQKTFSTREERTRIRLSVRIFFQIFMVAVTSILGASRAISM